MSHAANLRAHQQHAASSKRRKLSSDTSTRPVANGLNGLVSAAAFGGLSAKHKHNAKPSTKLEPAAAPHIGRAAEDEEMTEEVNGVNEASSDESLEEDEDDSDEEAEDSAQEEDLEEDDPTKALKRRSSKNDDNSRNANSDSHRQPNGVSTKQSRRQHTTASQEDPGQDAPEEPSFGDLLRAQATEQIDVPADEHNAANLLSSRPTNTLAPPSAASLGTVLTQALRSNDLALLESCLQVSNLQSIRATVERLPSVHAATLLAKLAERMHKRPGRAGSLMVWVQWTVVAHGGYLATQPAAMAQVKELYRVVKMRATSLQPLLSLKGKLDMLEAQVALRRRHTAAAADEQENVVYVEDEESSDDSESSPPPRTEAARRGNADDMALLGSSDDDEAMPLTNGTSVPASDEEDDADAGLEEELESDDEEDLIDDEAESADNDSDGGMSDDDIVFDDVEDDEASDEETSRPTKRARAKR